MKEFGRRLLRGWMKVAHVIGTVNAIVFLTIFYFVLLAPFALAVKLFSDPLRIKRRTGAWLDKPPALADAAKRQS